MKLHGILFLMFISLCLLPETNAQTRKYSNEFLSIGVGARAMAMANAQVAVTDDITSAYWNPSGLTRMEPDLQLSLMHAEYFAGIANYDYGGVGLHAGEQSTLAISFLRFGVDDIPNTLNLIDENGQIHYDRVSAFSAVDYAFMLSYARDLNTSGLSLGGSAKVVHRKVGSFARAWGFGLDLGAQHVTGNFVLGFMARDVTTTFNAWSFSFTDEERETLTKTGNIVPEKSVEITLPKTTIGGSYNWPISDKFNLLAAIDIEVSYDGRRNTIIKGDPVSAAPRMGLEFGMWNIVYLRGGIGNFQEETLVSALADKEVITFQPNIGIGLHFKMITLDYAFTDLGDNSIAYNSHIISLKFDLNKENEGQED